VLATASVEDPPTTVTGTTTRLSVLAAVDMLSADVDVDTPGSAFDVAVLPLASGTGVEVDLLIADATDSRLDSTLDRDATSERALSVVAAVAAILLGCDAVNDA